LPVRKVSQEAGQIVSESRNGYYIFKSHNENIFRLAFKGKNSHKIG